MKVITSAITMMKSMDITTITEILTLIKKLINICMITRS
jgi:hypothetical protein